MYVLCLCIWAWTRQRPEREKAPNAQTGFPPFILFLGTRCLFILPRRSFSRSLAMVRIDHTNFLPLLSITLLKGFSFKKGKIVRPATIIASNISDRHSRSLFLSNVGPRNDNNSQSGTGTGCRRVWRRAIVSNRMRYDWLLLELTIRSLREALS